MDLKPLAHLQCEFSMIPQVSKKKTTNWANIWTIHPWNHWEFCSSREFRMWPWWKPAAAAMPASPWVTVPSVKPVIAHAGSVPLHATVPAPLKPALRSRTFHVHAATIFLHWNMAVGTWLGCFLDCFFRCLFPPGLHGCVFINCISLLGRSSLCAEERAAFLFMVFFFTFTAEHKPTAYSIAWFTYNLPHSWFR